MMKTRQRSKTVINQSCTTNKEMADFVQEVRVRSVPTMEILAAALAQFAMDDLVQARTQGWRSLIMMGQTHRVTPVRTEELWTKGEGN